jgi:hypothetical protein
MTSTAHAYKVFYSNNQIEENPILKYFVNTQIMELFIKNKVVCPKKLIDETKKAKSGLSTKHIKNLTPFMKKMKFLNKGNKQQEEEVERLYNEYRQEEKYYGTNQEPRKSIIVLMEGKEQGKDIDMNLRQFISEKQDAKCFTFNRKMEKLNWLETADTQREFAGFKKLIRKGDICCREYNNKELIMNGTSKWYSLVIQLPNEVVGVDIAGIKIFNFSVDGVCYFFSNKKNRDAMFKWINK